MSSATEVRQTVRTILCDFVERDLTADEHGRLTFRFDSAQVYVDVRDVEPDSTVVRIVAPLNFAIPSSPELFRWVATHNVYDYGHLRATEGGSGVDLEFRHSLLGDHLDAEELAQAVTAIATTADDLDDEVKKRFGGSRFHEDSAWGGRLT